jgi:hypothetical protein
MKPTILLLWLPLFLLISCTKTENSTPMALRSDSIEGTYAGYRSQPSDQKAATDSTKITLIVTRLAENQVEILQTLPNQFQYTVTMQDHRFTYDRGITEAACGVARIKGEGSFKGGTLYLLETLECTRTLTAAKTFTQLRASKQ